MPKAAAPPSDAVKKPETKQLTEVQKYKLFNVHLSQKVSQLEKDKVTQMNTIVALQTEIHALKAAQVNTDAENVYKELGIKQGDELELKNDGTLTINPPAAGAPKPTQELFSKKNKRGNGERRGPMSTQPD